MRIPKLRTERLLLKPLGAEDAPQIQMLYPHWEIVRYAVPSAPWPHPDNSAENYINNIVLPDMEKGITWIWTIRLRKTPDAPISLTCLYDAEDNDRGFQLVPEYREQDFIREASSVATSYWSNTLNRMASRASKASLNIRSIRTSDSSGMRLIKTEKKEYASGLLGSELWEITRDEWNAYQVG